MGICHIHGVVFPNWWVKNIQPDADKHSHKYVNVATAHVTIWFLNAENVVSACGDC